MRPGDAREAELDVLLAEQVEHDQLDRRRGPRVAEADDRADRDLEAVRQITDVASTPVPLVKKRSVGCDGVMQIGGVTADAPAGIDSDAAAHGRAVEGPAGGTAGERPIRGAGGTARSPATA